MKANRYLVPILGVVLLLGTVGVSMLTGDWIVSGKQLIDVEQMTSSADIRGWMTLEQVATGLQIELPVLYELAGVPAEIAPETALKEMEQIVPDFETSTVRDAVAVYLGETEAEAAAAEAAEPEEPAPAESPAADTAEVTATPEPTAVHVPQNDGTGISAGEGTGPTPPPPGTRLAASEIKGRHTLQEIADQALVPLDALLAELGLPADTNPAQSMRDLVESGQVDEVETVRAAVTKLQAGTD